MDKKNKQKKKMKHKEWLWSMTQTKLIEVIIATVWEVHRHLNICTITQLAKHEYILYKGLPIVIKNCSFYKIAENCLETFCLWYNLFSSFFWVWERSGTTILNVYYVQEKNEQWLRCISIVSCCRSGVWTSFSKHIFHLYKCDFD